MHVAKRYNYIIIIIYHLQISIEHFVNVNRETFNFNKIFTERGAKLL